MFAPVSPSPDSLRILLVEDNEPNIMVAGYYLEMLGYCYDVARNGMQAFEKFKSGFYTVILMDVNMPGADGLEITRMIRQHEYSQRLHRTIIIGMTAHALAGDRERCINAGMDNYIPKPISEPELRNKLQAAMQPR